MLWDRNLKRLVLKRAKDGRDLSAGVYYEAYRKANGAWVRETAGEADFKALEGVRFPYRVSVEEGLNTPPSYTFLAGDEEAGAVFRNLNPQLADIALARTEERIWTGPNGIEWSAALVYPVDYEPGKRYPFILQTHGYYPSEYIVDGPGRVSSGYGARSFSARGFFVMQLADPPAIFTVDEKEAPNITAVYEDIVDQLHEEGLIDRERVGAVGWSRTAFHVMQAAWRNPGLFASVTANDGIQRGYIEFFSQLHWGRNHMRDLMTQTNAGALPIGEGLDEFRKHALTFNLDKVTAAVLVEPMRANSLLLMWETYAVLKFLGKAVELLYHPAGVHALQNPSERYASQKMAVQWHQFWLTGVEELDPLFEDQYFRWRQMREESCATMRTKRRDAPVYCDFAR